MSTGKPGEHAISVYYGRVMTDGVHCVEQTTPWTKRLAGLVAVAGGSLAKYIRVQRAPVMTTVARGGGGATAVTAG